MKTFVVKLTLDQVEALNVAAQYALSGDKEDRIATLGDEIHLHKACRSAEKKLEQILKCTGVR